jgi:hypothetical protein
LHCYKTTMTPWLLIWLVFLSRSMAPQKPQQQRNKTASSVSTTLTFTEHCTLAYSPYLWIQCSQSQKSKETKTPCNAFRFLNQALSSSTLSNARQLLALNFSGSNFGLESLQNPPKKKKQKKTLQLRTTLLSVITHQYKHPGNEAQSGGKKWLRNGKPES